MPALRNVFVFSLFYLKVFSRLHTAGANLDAAAAGQGRPLEIGVFANFSGRVELGSANTVGISSPDERSFIAYRTCFCHTNFFDFCF
jgi:hypothetical protein